jgi:hypothetical protein
MRLSFGGIAWGFRRPGSEAVNLQGRSRWLALGVIGLAILGAALWITLPWATHTEHRAASAAIPAPVQQGSGVANTAGVEPSDMLKMTRAAFVACGAPKAPSDVPDATTATREQMVAAHATVKAFDEATMIYNQCVDATAYQAAVQFKTVATSADTEAVSALQIQLHNAAIDRDQEVANRFNVQLRRFKARAGK